MTAELDLKAYIRDIPDFPKPGILFRDITPLLKQPEAAWDFPAITTFGYKNHAIRTSGWRYIRYENGDEELYDCQADPLEYVNLANRTDHATRKAELAEWLPKLDAADLPARNSSSPE